LLLFALKVAFGAIQDLKLGLIAYGMAAIRRYRK